MAARARLRCNGFFDSPQKEHTMDKHRLDKDRPLAKEPARSDEPDAMERAVGGHPVGTSAGAVGGIAAGAAMGSVAGPVGSLVGAAVGGVAGALMGSGIAEMIDPEAHAGYWRDEFPNRPYAGGGRYEDYDPAYRYGVDSYARYNGRAWEDVEADLRSGWDSARGGSSLRWDDARHAARDAWQRVSDQVERATPGDSDRDGR
jgi:hypothetical protein